MTPTPEAMVRAALAAARRATATGDVPIGAAVFGPDGTELAAACNAREALGDPTAHAEVLARVDKVVFGAWEPRTGAVGSLWDVVRDRRLNHRPEVQGGVLEADCAALLADFFTDQRPV